MSRFCRGTFRAIFRATVADIGQVTNNSYTVHTDVYTGIQLTNAGKISMRLTVIIMLYHTGIMSI